MNSPEGAAVGVSHDAEMPLRRRLRMLGQIALSVTIDVAVLALFACVGTISYRVPVLYALISGAIIVVFYFALRSDWAARHPDPALTRMQLLASSMVELGFALYAPAMAFYFFNILFLAFAFGALRLNLRQMLTSFAIVTLAALYVRLSLGKQLQIPDDTKIEELLAWVGQGVTLLRCCMVGWYGNSLRHALNVRNRELANAAQRIGHLATHDSLTDVLRRAPLWQLIEQQRCPPPFSIAMLDVDHFKGINDRYGHVVGDEVLRLFADIVRTTLRPDDAVGRYGGEEFLVLLRETDPQLALRIIDRVRQAIESTDWSTVAEGLKVTVSSGVAGAHADEPIKQLINRADRALYAAKTGGRNRALLISDDGQFVPAPAA